MLKKAPLQYVFNFHTLTLLVLTTLCYIILLVSLHEQRLITSQKAFNQLYYELTDQLNHNTLNLPAVSTKLIGSNNVSHHVMVMTASGQPLVYTHHRDDQSQVEFFSLPYWGPPEAQSTKYQITDSKQLLGWANLPNGYQTYIQIIHPPMPINWFNPLYWLPLLTALVLFTFNLYLVMRNKRAWSKIIDYSQHFPNCLNEPYTPIFDNDLGVSQEYLRLANRLDRINQQLHQTHRRTTLLEKRLLRLTDYSPLPLFFINKKGQVSYFNRRFEQSFMTAFDEHIIYFVTDFLTGKDKLTQRHLSRIGRLTNAQTFNVSSIESQTDYLLHLQPWTGQQGQVQGFSAVLTDISHLTQELGDITKKVHSQAAELIQFDKLWSLLGHELRTPLSGMISLINLIDTGRLDEYQNETYRLLLQTSQTMLTMLNDMLDIAKMDAGKLNTVLERIDILNLSYQVANLLSSSAYAKKIELLTFFYPQAPRYLDTDATRLQQILMNLISNAIKFTHSGYVALHVRYLTARSTQLRHMMVEASLSPQADIQSPWVCFSVEDTGIGIEENDKSRLFSDFHQANGLISQQFGGTGLGLAISNRFAQLLGGFIHIKSELGQGSTFSLCLPITSDLYQIPAYLHHPHLSKVQLVSFHNQPVSSQVFNEFSQFLNHNFKAYAGITKEGLDTVTRANDSDRILVILVEEELYQTGSITELEALDAWQSTPKILLTMRPRNAIDKARRDQYSVILNKPIMAAQIARALIQICRMKAQSPSVMPPIEQRQRITPSLPSLPAPARVSTNKALTFKPLVLIAEDDALNRRIVSALLNKLGYLSISANNGQEVLSHLEQREDIDLILMDCRMPIIDGLETTRIIRTSNNPIPIIALTANNTDNDKAECLIAGMNDFLTKPINKELLAKILSFYL